MMKIMKKQKTFKIALLLLAVLFNQSALRAQSLTDGMVAYWSFDQQDFQDKGPSQLYHGEAMGSDLIEFGDGPNGAFGSAINLNGVDQYVQIVGGESDALSFSESSSVAENATGSMSVSAWFRVESFDVSWQALIAQGEGNRWRIHRRGEETGLAFAGGNNDTPTAVDAGANVNDGAWHHVVAVASVDGLDDHDGFTALYIDGEVASVNTAASALEVNPSDLQIMIGANPDTSPLRFWNGSIDDVALWSRVLSPSEVAALYDGGAGMPINELFIKENTIEILGVGADFLIGGDLTDPEDDGNEAAGPEDPSWNWTSIESNIEPGFEGGEFSYNIFDNAVGGGNAKWCCDDPTDENPYWVAVSFANPVALTHFTITSGNDTPDRDPIRWAIQGSNDGSQYQDIYNYNEETSFFTERNQVALITLAETSVPYTYLRYIVYHTPGSLHQINEIEYFGCIGGCGGPVFAGATRDLTSLSLSVKQGEDTDLDASTIQLTLDGESVAFNASKAGGVTTIRYTQDERFAPGSRHQWSLSGLDTVGNAFTKSGQWTTDLYGSLTAADKVNPDTSKPGFMFEVHQNEAFTANTNQRAAQQLNGELGENLADSYWVYEALTEGEPKLPDVGYTGNITFEVEGVINFNQDDGGAAGEFTPDAGIPGVPGLNGSTDGIAGRITTYIDFPAGEHTLIVNSDDGFFTTVGIPGDLFGSRLAGTFEGGRGAADTGFSIYVEEAGVYPVTTVWYEGGGGANIEFKSVKADGTRALINDTANGGLKAYRATTDGVPAKVTSVSPAIGTREALPDANITATILDGDVSVNTASVSVKLNGVDAGAKATKANGLTTVTVDRGGALWAPKEKVTAELTYTAGSSSRTVSWDFVVSEIFGPASSADVITRGLVAYWPFDGQDLVDAKGGFDGTSNGEFPVGFSDGLDGFGKALTLDGIDQFVEITGGAPDDLAFAGQAMTLSTWFRAGAFDKSWQALVAKGEGTNWRVHRRGEETGVAFAAGNGDTPSAVGAGANVDDGQWHHLVGTANGPYGTILYIDGEIVAENTASAALSANGQRMKIGENPGALGRTWNGDIDDVALWNRALSAEEVAVLYNGGAGTPVSAFDLNPPQSGAGGIASVAMANGSVVIEYTGTLKSAATVTGPYSAVAGASSPYSVAPTQSAEFYIAE